MLQHRALPTSGVKTPAFPELSGTAEAVPSCGGRGSSRGWRLEAGRKKPAGRDRREKSSALPRQNSTGTQKPWKGAATGKMIRRDPSSARGRGSDGHLQAAASRER